MKDSMCNFYLQYNTNFNCKILRVLRKFQKYISLSVINMYNLNCHYFANSMSKYRKL